MTRIFCILLLISATSPLVANDSSSPFTKSWTHVNGNSATLELLLCNGDQVTFLRPDGKSWTMPINQLIEEDREIAVAMAQQRGSGFYVSSHLQDEELQAIRDRFAAMKNENADLYNRLTNLAEFPVEEYQIDVNEEGTYFLQFFLKPGVSADATIADDVAQYLNPDPLNEVDFKLSQVAQAAEVVEVADAAEESETSDEPMDSPSDLNSTVVENTAPQEAEKSVIDKITPPSPDDEMSDKAVSKSAPLSDMTRSNPVTVTAGCSNCCNSY